MRGPVASCQTRPGRQAGTAPLKKLGAGAIIDPYSVFDVVRGRREAKEFEVQFDFQRAGEIRLRRPEAQGSRPGEGVAEGMERVKRMI